MPRYPIVLFDLDGTLIDSVALILGSFRHTEQVHAIPPKTDDEWLAGLGTTLRTQFAPYDGVYGTMEELIATYRSYNLTHHDAMVTVYDGVVPMLRALHGGGHRLGLVTSKAHAGARRGLRLAGVEELFEVVVGADDVTQPKPHPEPVHTALARHGATVADAVFIGDSTHDMHSGRAAGVATAAALWGPFDRAHLSASAPDHWLERPDDVLRLVELA
ncbi:MAG: HAD-IA family hydrolase [Gemmatimonadales bacterium]|nr:HAD-IA family hydrolase [Gemmatimonadales bacterium]